MYFEDNIDKIVSDIIDNGQVEKIFKNVRQIQKEEQEKRHQFYNDITEDDKAEFINGEVILHSPVKLMHLDSSANLFNLIYNFLKEKSIGKCYTEKAMISLTRNDYEPDIVFFRDEKIKKFKPDQMLFPAPDFITEILSPSTAKNDRGIKFSDYAKHGIPEYWIIDPEAETVEQYFIKDGVYAINNKYSDQQIIESLAIEGFSVTCADIFK